MLRNLKNQKGFTLIELMIVVAIIGILSAIAIPNFLTFRLKAKTSEAKSNLGSIRTCEEAYKAETDSYYAITTAYPGSATSTKQTWTTSATAFSAIGFEPSGKVYYDYSVVSTSASVFSAYAFGDLDADGQDSTYRITHDGSDITRVSAASIY